MICDPFIINQIFSKLDYRRVLRLVNKDIILINQALARIQNIIYKLLITTDVQQSGSFLLFWKKIYTLI